jgi:hypothetical protein
MVSFKKFYKIKKGNARSFGIEAEPEMALPLLLISIVNLQ